MCLIIHRRQNTKVDITSNMFLSAFNRNNDGWGIMYAEGGEVHTFKGFALEELAAKVEELNEEKDEFFVHLRMATHGKVIEDNTHPFHVGAGIYMMHNGVLNIEAEDPIKSDTALFAEAIYDLLNDNPELIQTKMFDDFCAMYAKSDRLLFLTPEGEHYIYGKGTWTEHSSGLLLSNTYAWNDYSSSSYHYNSSKNNSSNYWYYGYTNIGDEDDNAGMMDYYSMHGVGAGINSTSSNVDDSYDFYTDEHSNEFPEEYMQIARHQAIENVKKNNVPLLTLEDLLLLSKEEMNTIAWETPSYFSDSVFSALSDLIVDDIKEKVASIKEGWQ